MVLPTHLVLNLKTFACHASRTFALSLLCRGPFVFAKSAEREFKNLTKRDRELAAELPSVIFALESNPRPANHKKLSGEEALYRIRMKDYRIVYQIHDDRLVILVLRVAHRREVYKKRT